MTDKGKMDVPPAINDAFAGMLQNVAAYFHSKDHEYDVTPHHASADTKLGPCLWIDDVPKELQPDLSKWLTVAGVEYKSLDGASGAEYAIPLATLTVEQIEAVNAEIRKDLYPLKLREFAAAFDERFKNERADTQLDGLVHVIGRLSSVPEKIKVEAMRSLAKAAQAIEGPQVS
jgi:hypothetical protein